MSYDVGPDSEDGVATRYGLDSPRIELRWVRRLSAPILTGPGAHLPSYTRGTWSFPGREVDYPTPCSANFQE